MIMKNVTPAMKNAAKTALENYFGKDYKNFHADDVRFTYRKNVYRINENANGTYNILVLPYSGAYQFSEFAENVTL